MTALLDLNNLNGLTSAALPEDNALYMQNALASMSENTRRNYSSRFSAFCSFVAAQPADQDGLKPSALPAAPAIVARFIESLKAAGRKFATIQQSVSAISKVHQIALLPDPCKDVRVKLAMSATAREITTAQQPKAAATKSIVKELIARLSGSPLTVKRNAALLAVGFYGAFRRSELAALKVSDIEKKVDKTGLPLIVLTVRRSKTDKTGKGTQKAIFSTAGVNPVKLLTEWLKAYKPEGPEAPLFPSIHNGIAKDSAMRGADVASVVKAAAASAGLDPEYFSGHSLRRGFVTSAVEAGASERSIMNQTGHKSVTTVRRYIERHAVEADNAAALI